MSEIQLDAPITPKSPYRTFIEENDQILNSLSRNDDHNFFQMNQLSESTFQEEEEDSENEYYESLKESIDSINQKLGIAPKFKEEIKTSSSEIEKTKNNSISKIDSQSDILPSQKVVCPSPLDKKKEQNNSFLSSEEKDNSGELERIMNLIHSEGSQSKDQKNSEQSDNSNISTPKSKSKHRTNEKTSNNNSAKSNKSQKSQLHSNKNDISFTSNKKDKSEAGKNRQTPNKKLNSPLNNSKVSSAKKGNSLVSNHSKTPNKDTISVSDKPSQKANSPVSNNSRASRIKKEDSFVSANNQTPSKKDNINQASNLENHSKTPNSKKDNSMISNNSYASSYRKVNSTNEPKSMISSSYIDYIDGKQKRILEKWKAEDIEAEKQREEDLIDLLLTPKHTWKTYKFTTPQTSITSKNASNDTKTEVDDEDVNEASITDRRKSHQVFEMPPNPSNNLKQMLEIPATERLLANSRNFSDHTEKQQNSVKPRKIQTNDNDFIIRQAHYENEKRLKFSPKTITTSQRIRPKKKDDNSTFNRLFEESIINSDSSENGNESEKESKIKWSNKSHLVENRDVPDRKPHEKSSQEDEKNLRDKRFSPMSQLIAEKETRSFQERTSYDFKDVLKQNKDEKEEKAKRDLYNQHLESLD